MAHGIRIHIIDQDLLLSASGVIAMRPSGQIAVVVDPNSDEKAIRDFFRNNWSIELAHSYFNDTIKKHLGLKTFSIRTHLCSDLRNHPNIIEAMDLDQLRHSLARRLVAEEEAIAPKDRGPSR